MKNTLRIYYQEGNEIPDPDEKIKFQNLQQEYSYIWNKGKFIYQDKFEKEINNFKLINAWIEIFIHEKEFWVFSSVNNKANKSVELCRRKYTTKREAYTYKRGFKRRIERTYPGIKITMRTGE